MTMNKPQPGVGYTINSTNRGFSFDINENYDSEATIGVYNVLAPFACIVDKIQFGGGFSHRLKVVKGEVAYNWAVSDQGFIAEGSLNPYFYNISKFNLYPSGSLHTGADASSIFINQNGYISLDAGSDYVVFVYMLGPFFEVENTYDFRVPQLCVSKIGDYPEENINNIPNVSNRDATINSWLTIGEAAQTIVLKYRNTFSLRDNIARIKWNSTKSRFDIEQITNYPNMKFTPNVIGGSNTEPSFYSTTVDGIINPITGYTKDLNEDSIGYTAVEQGEL